MRLSTRTALAAALAAALSLGVLGILFRGRVHDVLLERVDRQLEERASTAPILAAVGDRLAVSELGSTVEGARVLRADGQTIAIGALPDGTLPPIERPGWSTARVGDQNWRLYTVEVDDVPKAGDRTLVQLAAPLGDVERLSRQQRRSTLALAAIAVVVCGAIGYGLGELAARPLARLRRDAGRIGDSATPPIAPAYGAVEVDEIAAALRAGLDQVAEQQAGREAAFETARSFAASVTHELRTPLTGAVTNLDIAGATVGDSPAHQEAVADARAQLDRIASALTALRSLADAELADPSWFTEFDLGDQVIAVVDAERRREPGARIEVEVLGPGGVIAWADGVRLAVSNLVRNALAHGRGPDGAAHVLVVVHRDGERASVVVEDRGPGVPTDDRARVVRRFEKGPDSSGSGLGLALVGQVAALHGGTLTLDAAPGGGAQATLTIHVGLPR